MEGRKSPSPIEFAHSLYNSLYCHTSRDYINWHSGEQVAHSALVFLAKYDIDVVVYGGHTNDNANNMTVGSMACTPESVM